MTMCNLSREWAAMPIHCGEAEPSPREGPLYSLASRVGHPSRVVQGWRKARNLVKGMPVLSVSRGVDFIGTTVGLAKVSALCSRHSGAVNQVKGMAKDMWVDGSKTVLMNMSS